MKKRHIRDAAWFPMAVAICIGVLFYVILSRFPVLWTAIKTFIGYFRPLIIGCVIAYIVDPLSMLFTRIFKNKQLSVGLAFLVVLCILVFVLIILIPQLLDSVTTFMNNLDGYIASVNEWLEGWGVSKRTFNLNKIISSSESLLSSVSGMIVDNIENILEAFASAGKDVVQWGISFILAVYILMDKDRLKIGIERLFTAVFGEGRVQRMSSFMGQCDGICSRYIVYNMLDCFIVGIVNAIFMFIFGMQYPGLISIVVAVGNFIPTFGPLIATIIGAFVLLMFNPVHSLIFLIFTILLQALDAYLLRPRLFGNSLGVSGFWILVGIVVGGNMFGVIGVILSVPVVAIIDMVYKTQLLPWLETWRAAKEEKKD